MSRGSEVETNFALVMQELSAEASSAAVVSMKQKAEQDSSALGISSLISAVHSLGQRVETLEESVMRKFESLQFQKLEEQLAAIRDTENVNQKLFDTLHEELISYRDNFVRDSLQKPFIRDLLVLHDDLSAITWQFEEAASTEEENRPEKIKARENLNNMLHFLIEILHRLEVTEVEQLATVDFTVHRVIGYVAAENPAEDGRILKRVKQGFKWHGKVLRPEEVVALRFG
jgi:molecular chaperone GrpE (heat shock protein)